MTQRALALRLGTAETAVANWESGKRVPRVDRLAALAQILGVRPTELTGQADDGPASLQQLRVDAGLLQEQVAQRAGMTKTRYSALERGEIARLVDADAAALAAVLGVEVDEVRTAHSVGRASHLGR